MIVPHVPLQSNTCSFSEANSKESENNNNCKKKTVHKLMPYYQATKSQNFEFSLTVLPYLVTHPSGPLGLVGVFMGDL